MVRFAPCEYLAALHGVLFINSIYVWPKLSAAAFCLAGWVLLRGRLDAGTSVRDTLIGGLCLVLGFLCHGAAAFAACGVYSIRSTLTFCGKAAPTLYTARAGGPGRIAFYSHPPRR